MDDHQPLTIEAIRERRKHRSAVSYVKFDQSLEAELIALEREWKQEADLDERENRVPVAPRIRQRIDELSRQDQDLWVPIPITQLSRIRYTELLDACRDEDGHLVDDEFAPALIQACTGMDMDVVRFMCFDEDDGLPPDQFQKLYIDCVALHTVGSQVPKFASGSDGTPSSLPNLTSAAETVER